MKYVKLILIFILGYLLTLSCSNQVESISASPQEQQEMTGTITGIVVERLSNELVTGCKVHFKMEKEGINDTQLHVFNHGSVSTDDSGVYTIDFSFYGEPLEKIYVEILTEQENFQQADTSFAFTFTNASNNRDFTVDFALSAIPPEQEKNSTIKGIVRDRFSSELISDCKLLFTMKKKLNGDPRLFVFNEDSIITDSNGSYSVDFTYKESFEKIYVEIRSYKEDYLQGDALI
ncbi:MAG: hypothetical protein AAFP70_07345, partial [Calditrichota bacterium]